MPKMKDITIRIWVPDETPDPVAANYGRIEPKALIAWLRGLAKGSDYPPQINQLSAEDIRKIGDGIAEREYRETVSGIVEDLKRAVADGEVSDRDAAMDWLHDTIDGHHDVIYTYAAQEVLRHSRNDGAYFDHFGSEGAIQDDGINWSGLAYCALEADVLEAIGNLDEWFQCSECNGDITPEDVKAAGDNLPVCADCRNEDEPEEGDSDV